MKNSKLVLFKSPACSVCGSLNPKIKEIFSAEFPKLTVEEIDLSVKPEVSAEYGVFSVPAALLILEGKEYIRLTGSFSITELRSKTERYYQMLFE